MSSWLKKSGKKCFWIEHIKYIDYYQLLLLLKNRISGFITKKVLGNVTIYFLMHSAAEHAFEIIFIILHYFRESYQRGLHVSTGDLKPFNIVKTCNIWDRCI